MQTLSGIQDHTPRVLELSKSRLRCLTSLRPSLVKVNESSVCSEEGLWFNIRISHFRKTHCCQSWALTVNAATLEAVSHADDETTKIHSRLKRVRFIDLGLLDRGIKSSTLSKLSIYRDAELDNLKTANKRD